MVKAIKRKRQLIKKLLVYGDSFNSHFLVSHLLHRFPPDIEIMWIKSNPDQLPFSFTPSFEILNQLALFETPLEHIVSSCQGNLKTGTVYKNWPGNQDKTKSFFVPYYKDQDLQFNTLQYWLHSFKQDPELPNYWLKLALPAYTLFEEKKSPAYLKANGKIDAISPIGLQLLSKPFLKITESFLNPDSFRNLSIFNETVENCHFDSNGYLKAVELKNHQLSADLFFDCSSDLGLMKKLGNNYEPPSSASFENIYSTHFSIPNQKNDDLPAYDECYATESGFIKVDYLYQLKSITYYSDKKIDKQKLVELCAKEGIFQTENAKELSTQLSFIDNTTSFGQKQKIWQKNILNFSTSQSSNFPLEDFSIKLFNYSIELLK
ncbi:MAG: tryptophan 7-halogenase, partial [Chlamydiales bacterium]|nr:tryptophan 7-halogenase [Chlamydiales bacterium]